MIEGCVFTNIIKVPHLLLTFVGVFNPSPSPKALFFSETSSTMRYKKNFNRKLFHTSIFIKLALILSSYLPQKRYKWGRVQMTLPGNAIQHKPLIE